MIDLVEAVQDPTFTKTISRCGETFLVEYCVLGMVWGLNLDYRQQILTTLTATHFEVVGYAGQKLKCWGTVHFVVRLTIIEL